MRILLADDVSDLREMLEEHLKSNGHEVIVAANGNEAATHVEKGNCFGTIILDLRMPGCSVVDLIKMAKRLAPKPRVIIISSFATDEVEKTALQAGADDVVQKPFRVAEFLSIIQGVTPRT